MCICADVDGDGSAESVASPVVLCVIKAYSDGRAEFRPSMTSQNNGNPGRPHLFVSPKGVCFEYELSNLAAPKPLDPAQQAKRDRDLRRMQDRVVGMRRSLVGSMFEDVPAQQDLRLHVFGEFVEGYVVTFWSVYALRNALVSVGVLSTTASTFATACKCPRCGPSRRDPSWSHLRKFRARSSSHSLPALRTPQASTCGVGRCRSLLP
jgi:hypothetical protein